MRGALGFGVRDRGARVARTQSVVRMPTLCGVGSASGLVVGDLKSISRGSRVVLRN